MNKTLKRGLPALFLMITLSVSAQDLFLGYHTGIGTYRMKDLKEFNQQTQDLMPFKTRAIQDFPAWFYHKISAVVTLEKVNMGLVLTKTSTGARYSAGDYSAVYRYDNTIKSFGPGFLIDFRIHSGNGFLFYYTNEFAILSSTLVLEEYMDLSGDELFNESYRFKGTDFSWEPGFRVSYPFRTLRAEAYLAYTIQLNGKGLEYQGSVGNADWQYLGENINAGWSGLRMGIGLMLNLTQLAKS